jgi:hypothetical protein
VVDLSVVVVAFEMARELPRTLHSLLTPHQIGLDARDYEVIVVDNGSSPPLGLPDLPPGGPEVRLRRVEEATPSPAAAANAGIASARGALVGLIIDGARIASPGLLSTALQASRLYERAVITAPAWHLGPVVHMEAEAGGFDQAAEDALLDACGWRSDGYALFDVSTPAASSARGLFGQMGESSSLFLAAPLWAELGGLDQRFELPGGGLVNHDLYRRACELEDARLVVLLGEGTFHQIHGGAATSGRVNRETMRADYEALRGAPYSPPAAAPVYLGSVPPQYLAYLESSLELARGRQASADP